MPRDGARTLSDLRETALTVVCMRCGRQGRYAVAKLLEQHGDAKLPDVLEALPIAPRFDPPASMIAAR